MRKFFILTLMFCSVGVTSVYSQVGIPTSTPNKDAVLDLNRTDGTNVKGLLLPKIALTALNSSQPMTAHIAGMHVWNTATAGTGVNAVTPGEYFNDGTKWLRISSSSDVWLQDGNSNGAVKSIGTNDAFDLPIKTNSTEKIRLTSGGQLLLNTATPLVGGANAKLQINNGSTIGALQIKDGTEGLGKVLTSDVNGLATWQSSAVSYIQGDLFIGTKSIPTTGGDVFQGSSITLPPGTWLLRAYGYFSVDTFDGGSTVAWVLSTSDSTLSVVGGSGLASAPIAQVTAYCFNNSEFKPITVNATTTYYLFGKINRGTGTVTMSVFEGNFYAMRIR